MLANVSYTCCLFHINKHKTFFIYLARKGKCLVGREHVRWEVGSDFQKVSINIMDFKTPVQVIPKYHVSWLIYFFKERRLLLCLGLK